jgi:hypothetical protein
VKPVVLEFVGGNWDGRSLSTDSDDQQEALLAAACYEICHHGSIGEECAGLSNDAVTFARTHGWAVPKEARWHGIHHYLVTERRETQKEIVVKLSHTPAASL